jgi:6-phosphogluconolactonase (cycloisomerase 2 family)
MIAGSPFATGANGGIYGVVSASIAIAKGFLYAANEGSNNISAFAINPATGVLTTVAGSPFATGGSAGAAYIPLAATPDGNFLIAADSVSGIAVYSIAVNGTLSPVPGSPFPVGPGAFPYGIKVTPDGKFLAVANLSTNSVSMFSISGLGGLTPVTGSPFSAGEAGEAVGVDCNCNSNQLFIAEGSGVSVQKIALNGALSPVSGSPFVGVPGIGSEAVVLSPDDSDLFASDHWSNSVTAFSVAATGALTVVPGSPFLTVKTGSSRLGGMATNQSGTFLYVAAEDGRIGGFRIAPSGALTPLPGSPFSNGAMGAFRSHSLVVFPPKFCCITGASASPDVLWPPNSKFVDVTIGYTISAASCPNSCVLTVSSNEPPVDDNVPEWVVVDAHHVQLQADRLGSGTGRTYTITITCTNDTNNESSTQKVTVLVPHDQGQ